MNIFLNKKKFYLFILFYSLFAIFFALYVEYILGYKPCKLCLYQRVPYIVAIFISFVGYNYYKNNKILILIISIFLISFFIAGYHYGIEKNYWEGITSCSSKIDFNKDTLKNILSTDITRCDDVQFELLNLSLAGWNSLISISVFIISVYILYIFRRNEKTYDT